MTAKHQRNFRARFLVGFSTVAQGLIHGLAVLSLIMIIWLNILIWPVGFLGYATDPDTGTIGFVEPASSAARAGLKIGDQIVALYGQPWSALISAWNVLEFVPPTGATIPITIVRDGIERQVWLIHEPPSIEFQEAKAANLLLAALCWLVGYLLGIVRRSQANASALVALFWLALATVLGSYVFAAYASIPLQTLLQWILLAALIPAAAAMHVWFPPRSVTAAARWTQRCLLGWMLGAHVVLLAGIAAWRPALPQLLNTFSELVLVALLVGFIITGVILFRAYRETRIAHVRRQIRLIALACIVVASIWALALVIPLLVHMPVLLVDQRLNIVTAGIPLAYLIGGIGHDLDRIDRALIRVSLHLITTVMLVAGLTLVFRVLTVRSSDELLWVMVLFVLLYPSFRRLMQRLLRLRGSTEDPEHTLNATLTDLTTTLDTSAIIGRILTGIRESFNEPALAFYAGRIEGTNKLTLTTQERMPELPAVIVPGHVLDTLARSRAIMTSRQLSDMLHAELLQIDEEQAIRAPGVVLWCPIIHHDSYLLGLLLLGMRGNFDPYRGEDERALQRLMDASALALTNSAAYTQLLRAERTIRNFYQHLQQVQDATAAEIARELHDEVINVNVRLNVQSLERLLRRVQEPSLHEELSLLLESERTVIQSLRLMCEQLHPTGLDDPLGLAAVLRMQVERAQSQWSGECVLRIHGKACPVLPRVQRETMRIAREALTNAIKHAGATRIVVELGYPATLDQPLVLTVCDNGRNAQEIDPRPGHWGIPNMYESARAVGGRLTISPDTDGGMKVVFRFAATIPSIENRAGGTLISAGLHSWVGTHD